MGVAFFDTGSGHAHELRALQRGNVRGTAVAHAGPQAANDLVHHFEHGAFVRHAATDTLGNKFLEVVFCVLEVTVFRTFLHGFQRAHAAVAFEAAAFVNDGFARALFRTSEHRTDHHGICASGEAFDDVAREADAAVRNDRNSRAAERLRHLHHGTELGNADARDYTSRANRARSDADFNGVSSGLHQGLGGIGGGDVATNHVNGREGGFDFLQRFEHAAAVAVRRVDDDRVDAGVDKRLGAVNGVVRNADRSSDPQTSPLVLTGVGEGAELDDVTVGDKADELSVAVNHRQLFDAVGA